MSAIWGCAHEAEQPEKCILMTPASARSPAGNCSSSARAHLTARSFVSTTAKRQNSEPVQATTPRSKGPGKGEYCCTSGSASRSSSRSSGTPDITKFWSDADPDVPVAVGLGQAGQLHQLYPVHPADGDGAADVHQPGLLLGVDTDVVAAEAVGELSPRGHERERGALLERSPEAFGPQLLDQVAHPGQAAVLAVPELAEHLRHTSAELDRLIRQDEQVDVRRHPFAVGQAASDEDVEAEGPVRVGRRPQPDVVDLHPGAVLAASGHRDLELARQVGVLAVAREESRDGLGNR